MFINKEYTSYIYDLWLVSMLGTRERFTTSVSSKEQREGDRPTHQYHQGEGILDGGDALRSVILLTL